MSLNQREDLLKVTEPLARQLPKNQVLTQQHWTKNPWGKRYAVTQYYVPIDVALQAPSPYLRKRAKEAALRLMRVHNN